jgi:glycosyltransferase involved in cell wall biosynthesis
MSNIKTIIFFMPNIERGGIEKNFLLLSEYFLSKNYRVEVLCSNISKHVLLKINDKIIIRRSKNFIKIPISFLPKRVVNSINCFIYFICKLKKSKNSVIVSIQDHPFAIILSKIKKINCILRIANHPEASVKFFNNKLLFYIKLRIKIFFYKFSKEIICNSESSTVFLKKNIKKKITTIYNPLIFKKIIKNNKKFNYILSVGRLEKQKNFIGLIEAFNIVLKSFPNFRLIIIGNGSEKKNLIKKLNELKIKNKIIFKDFINPNYFFLRSKIFILNSFFEGMPNVILEALSNKCPVISTNCESGPKEILRNGKFGYLVDTNNYINLAKKIKYVLSNYMQAKKKTYLGYKSLNRFNLNAQCLKYKNVIDNSFK